MSRLKFEVFWDDPGESDFAEDYTLADLQVSVDKDYLTLHKRSNRLVHGGRTVSKTVYGPVAGLVDWFIENWSYVLWETQTPFKRAKARGLREARPPVPGAREAASRWEDYVLDDVVRGYDLGRIADWQHRHLLGHACSNLAIPSIVIVPEDRTILVVVDRLPQGSITFLGPDKSPRTATSYVIERADFVADVTQFVESVIARVREIGQHAEWAEWMRRRWQDAKEVASSPTTQLDLMIGRIGARRVEGLQQVEPVVASGLKQLLLDCETVNTQGELSPVEEVVRTYVGTNGTGHLSGETAGWEQLTGGAIRTDQPEYIQGYKLARHVRKQMRIGNDPLPNIDDVLKKLDVSLERDWSIPLFRAAACAKRGYQAHIIPSSSDPRMKLKPSRNFAVVSALGRLLWETRNPDERTICVAQGDHSIVSESRRANAFAAEFLLPTQVVSGLKTDSPDLLDVADKYGISHEAANWHALDIERLSSDGW